MQKVCYVNVEKRRGGSNGIVVISVGRHRAILRHEMRELQQISNGVFV